MSLELLKKDCVKSPQSVGYKLKKGTVTLSDQDEACKNPKHAYLFALCIKGADIKVCQETACKSPRFAYLFAFYIPGADIKICQEATSKDPEYAALFIKNIIVKVKYENI